VATYGSLRRTYARFDCFQVDLSSNELFCSGVRVPIQEQPFQVLRLLVEAEGKVVKRDQLRAALWPEDTFVDFEHGVNTAVKKLRQALEDSAENPKFVETLPRVGYRFLTPVEWVGGANAKNASPRLVEIPLPQAIARSPSAAIEKVSRSGRRLALIALALGLLLAVVVGAYLLRPGPPADILSVVPFTTLPGLEVAPRFSPDGNQVVFSWFGYDKDFQFDLYIKQVGQEHVFQLTHHPATFLGSAWSPDGRFIAFKREAEPKASGIFLISPIGGAERKLASITHFGGPEAIGIAWSPDSKWVAFSDTGSPENKGDLSPNHYSIHLVNIETYEEQILPDASPDCVQRLHPAFSPDGRYLASMCVPTEGSFRIYVQNSDGTHSREVTNVKSTAGFGDLAWAADSRSLIYAADHQLWRVRLSGGVPEKLLFAQDAESVSIARTAKRLAYAQVRHPGSIWELELAQRKKTRPPATKLISSSLGEGAAHVSPDNNHISFQSWRSGTPEVWVCDRDGSNPVQLTSFGGAQVGPPSWSPDSRRIVFDVRIAEKPQLYIVNIDGGPPKQLATDTPNASYPFWSADGGYIYFATEPPGAIWKAPVEGGPAVRLTAAGASAVAPQEAADGKRVFFYKVDSGHTQAWSTSASGDDERPVSGMPGDVTWQPTSSGIYFVEGAPRHFSLNYFDFATQQGNKVLDLPDLFVIWGFTLSPDGHRLLLSGIDHVEGDIVLVEGFR